MRKLLLPLFCVCAGALLGGCYENESSAPDMVDPWLRERTPVSFRLENQIGEAVITHDWRHDDEGAVSVRLVTGAINDMAAVKVEGIELQYGATASVQAGSTLDLSSGKGSFVVTAETGETREYTVTYSAFEEPLEGVYLFDPRGGILDGSAPKSAFIVLGGFDGSIVMSTAMDKWWQWGEGYMPTDEDDNTVSFKLARVDEQTGVSYGTILNLPGADGKWANYMYQNKAEKDMNGKYRILPKGKARWAKNPSSGDVTFYAWEDTEHATPLWTSKQLGAGTHAFWDKQVSVAGMSFYREHPGPFTNGMDDWSDDRWYVNNVRNTFYLMKKSSDTPLENHDELLKNEY
jgi:hypothetical protein